MARLINGILGGFVGKISNIEGYMLNGKNVVRGRRTKSNKPATPAQLAVRQRTGIVSKFHVPIVDFVNVGFKHSAIGTGKYAYNLASAYQFKNAITGEYPDCQIDYSKVRVTEGPIDISGINAAVKLEGDILRFTWTPDFTRKHRHDQVMMLAYATNSKEAVYNLRGAKRRMGTDVLEFGAGWENEEIAIYLSFIAEDSMLCANSIYLGRIKAADI